MKESGDLSWSMMENLSPPLSDIVLFSLSVLGFTSRFLKCCLLGRGFHTLINNVRSYSPTDVGSHNPPYLGPVSSLAQCLVFTLLQGPVSSRAHCPVSTLFQGPTSSLAHYPVSTLLQGLASWLSHRPMSNFDISCNNKSPPLANIVLFWLSLPESPQGF